MANLASKEAVPKGFFRLRADDMPAMSISAVEGLKGTITVTKYMDGTSQIAMLKLGKVEYDNLVVTGGESVAALIQWTNWFEQCAECSENGGLAGEDLMKTVDMIAEREDGAELYTVRHVRSLLASFEWDPRDADSSDTAKYKAEIAVTKRKFIAGAASG